MALYKILEKTWRLKLDSRRFKIFDGKIQNIAKKKLHQIDKWRSK